MVAAEQFVSELEGKNRDSFQRLVAGYLDSVAKEAFGVADIVKLELKSAVEALEAAALWLADSDSLDLKLTFASQCGDGARHYAALRERLRDLGVPPETFDPRQSGYSKLFAFLRALSTTEERASAGLLTVRASSIARLDALADWCEQKGDAETASLFRDQLAREQERHVDVGRSELLKVVASEEAQARARRASYRSIELMGEIQDPALLRKFVTRSRRA